MADSNITKRALASALRELMDEIPFEKINVAQICEKCDMNRKSFYYHFKDKYDLVNWIYDTEFISIVKNGSLSSGWEFLSLLCHYLYDNRNFYQKALKISGQNSFSDHFREMLIPVVAHQLQKILSVEVHELPAHISESEAQKFYIDFISDGFICAIERWLQEKDCIHADDFLFLIRSCISRMAEIANHDLNMIEK